MWGAWTGGRGASGVPKNWDAKAILTTSASLCQSKEIAQSSVLPPPPVKSAEMKPRVGQKVHSGFSFMAYAQGQTDFEANAVHYVYNVCMQVGFILYQQHHFKALKHFTGHLFTGSHQGTKSGPPSQPPATKGPRHLPGLSRPRSALSHGKALRCSSWKWVPMALSSMGF